MIQIDYQKRKNAELFKVLEKSDLTFLSHVQNYIPIYNRFFSLNETNFNSINLNHKWYVSNVREKIDEDFDIYSCTLKNINNNKTKVKDVFFKMAPLADPFKYLVGKILPDDKKLVVLPSFGSNEETVNAKYIEPNNSAYVDGFFSYLSSQLLNHYGFLNGIDYYGSFLGIKNNFKVNVIDDLDYLTSSEYFNTNKNVVFQVEDYSHLFGDEDGHKLPPIKIDHNISNKSFLSVKSLDDKMFEDVFENSEIKADEQNDHITLDDIKGLDMDIIDITTNDDDDGINSHCENKTTTLKSGTSCSSRSSHTSVDEEENSDCPDLKSIHSSKSGITLGEETCDDGETCEEGDEICDDDEESCDDSEETYDEFEEDDIIYATIPQMPVQMVCMESCENTFDNLILDNDLSDEEWFSALMQIIMSLITYQKVFNFTHNDLHSNNIMYISTESKFIYYCFKGKYYKVPTHGRLFKIIDFGRGIYKFDGKLFCSDSFQTGGDAATQYNTEPYFNDKKPRLEPNPSFDLCRLACSIFDYLVDDLNAIKHLEHCDKVTKLIVEWCLDDKGINMLYKNNGSERYPDFKLYKMIARCVHKHTPQSQLERDEFKSFLVSKEQIGPNDKVIDIDGMPILV